MITTIKIGKDLKIQKYKVNGIKLFFKFKGKWYLFKLNSHKTELLKYIITVINGKGKENKRDNKL